MREESSRAARWSSTKYKNKYPRIFPLKTTQTTHPPFSFSKIIFFFFLIGLQRPTVNKLKTFRDKAITRECVCLGLAYYISFNIKSSNALTQRDNENINYILRVKSMTLLTPNNAGM